MSSVDNRIVEMKFNNAEFQNGIKSTLSSLEELKKGLNLKGASKGLDEVSNAAKRFSLGGMLQGVSDMTSKFNALSVVGVTALATIANKAVNVGLQMAKSLTITPLKSGLQEYETNLNAIQTILANTSTKGGNLKTVNAALAELNEYSDKTIYNFAQMARNVGTFTAAGVGLDTSVAAIKGIANLAAVSGSNAEQASTAMYQISQALSTGTVKLMDWNSIVNAGMGGEVFQNSLKETARIQGVAVDNLIKKNGSFRDSLQEGWLTDEILTATLAKFTGDMTEAQLAAEGYNAKQIKEILALGKVSTDAATKVKTFSQLMGTLAEAAGSGWAKSWQLILGDFDQAKVLFTNVNNVLGGMIGASADARNKILGDWNTEGGRVALIDGVANAFKALMAIVKPIGEAFRTIFPPATGKQLADLTKIFRDFTKNLIIGAETANLLKRIFSGVFAVFGIGWELVKMGANLFRDLFGQLDLGGGSFLKIAASVGDFLVVLLGVIRSGGDVVQFFKNMFPAIFPVISALENFGNRARTIFSGLKPLLDAPIRLLKQLSAWAVRLFDSFDAGNATDAISGVTSKLTPLSKLAEIIRTGWDKALGILSKAGPIVKKFGDALGQVGEVMLSAFRDLDYDAVLRTINTGLFAGLILLIKKFLSGLTKGGGLQTGFLEAITSPFSQMTDTLKTMQNTLKAATLLQIAGAIGIMALAVIGLSKVDAAGLEQAMSAMTLMFVQLGGALAAFGAIAQKTPAHQLIGMGVALLLMATSIRILTSAVKALSELSWDELARGLTGVAVLIGGLAAASTVLSANSSGMISSSVGLLLMAGAIKILVSAVTDLSGLSWEEMAKGLGGVAVLLTALTLFTKFSEANGGGIGQGAGLLLLGFAIKILASAVEDFAQTSWEGLSKGLVAISGILVAVAVFSRTVGNPVKLVAAAGALVIIGVAMNVLAIAMVKFAKLRWEEIAKGLVSMAGALAIMAIALNSLPPSTLLSAAAIIIVASALGMVADAMLKMGGMSWEEIARGLVVLAGALAIITIAMNAMTGTVLGAAAMVVMASALRILVPVLVALGEMSWGEIAKGLLSLAGVFVIMGLAGVVLSPLVPVLIGLGLALTLMGAGLALAGVGVFAFSVALTTLAVSGGVAGAAIIGFVTGLLTLIPFAVTQIGAALLALGLAIQAAAPALFAAFTVLITEIIKAIVTMGPPVVNTLLNLVTMMLAELAKSVPKWAASALAMLLGILGAITKQAPAIVKSVTTLMLSLLAEVVKVVPRIVVAAVGLMVEFLSAVTRHIPTIVSSVVKLMVNFLSAITGKIPTIVKTVVNMMVAFLNGITTALPRITAAAVKLMVAFLEGIAKNVPKLITAATDIIVSFLNGIATNIPRILTAGADLIISFLQGIADTIRGKGPEISAAGMDIAKAILEGMTNGLKNGVGAVADAAKNVAKNALGAAKRFLGINSPSKEFIKVGESVNEGFAKGIVGSFSQTQGALDKMRDMLKASMDAQSEDVGKAQEKLAKLLETQKRLAADEPGKNATKAAIARDARMEAENAAAIKKARASLAEALELRARSNAANKVFNKDLEKQQKQLLNYADQHDEVTEALKEARQALKEAQDERNNFASSIFGKYSALPAIDLDPNKLQKEAQDAANKARSDKVTSIAVKYAVLPTIDKDTTLAAYKNAIHEETVATERFRETLSQLRNMGMDDVTYNKFLSDGLQSQPIIDELVAQGAGAVAELRYQNEALARAATSLGEQSAGALVDNVALTKTSLGTYIDAITVETEQNQKFKQSLDTLRAMGMDDTTYKKLLDEGLKTQPFLDELVASGTQGVGALNTLNTNLQNSAKALGEKAASDMYDAGVKVKAGLVKGLEGDLRKIEASMNKIAQVMVKAIKKALKIKSPSQEMVQVAKHVDEGLAKGLTLYSGLVEKSASGVANTALNSIRATLSDLSTGLSADMDINPVIRPVLDLSQIQKDASQIDGLMGVSSISGLATAYEHAMAISAERQASQTVSPDYTVPSQQTVLNLEQNNYSPKALSAVEIYRGTKNQLALAKEALKI